MLVFGWLYFHAVCAQVSKHCIDAVFVDGANGFLGQSQFNPTIFALNPKSTIMKIRVELTFRLVVGMRNIVSTGGFLSGDLTDSWHRFSSKVN